MPTITAESTLKTLLDEINNADPEMLPPPNKKESGDRHIGYLTDEYTRKIFSLGHFYKREAQRLQVDLEATGEEAKSSPEFTRQKQIHDTLLEMFWFLLRSQVNLWAIDIGIRKNWEIVECHTDSGDKLIDMLKKKLGGE